MHANGVLMHTQPVSRVLSDIYGIKKARAMRGLFQVHPPKEINISG